MAKKREPAARASLQETLRRLTRFWIGEGCSWLPSCDFEVEAGTFHPEVFFRLPGPDSWRAVFVQPVRRPLDGRRRGHPYRLHKHLQLQVVIKPPPSDLQALYLQSLEALGCELAVHDIRFAEWNWQSAALDAWGSGWHALIDGLGITRLTFLQEVAGRPLEPLAAELSYGLERLTLLLAEVPSVDELSWAPEGPAYGELRRREEAELSRYAFAVAGVDGWRRQLEDLLAEADRCLEAALARPAFELAVKSLQGVGMLEARGALASLERQRWLAAARSKIRAAAALSLDDREPASASVAEHGPAAPGSGERAQEPPPATGKKRRAAGKSRRRRRRGSADGG